MAKSNYEIEFHPEAILEIRAAIEWYRERDEFVSNCFAEDLSRGRNECELREMRLGARTNLQGFIRSSNSNRFRLIVDVQVSPRKEARSN
jgi:hypothetical protein